MPKSKKAKIKKSDEIISEDLRARIESARAAADQEGRTFYLRDVMKVRNPATAFDKGLQDAYLYTMHGSMKVSLEDMKAEYNRLRNIANKRINRLVQAGYGEIQEVQNNINRFGPLGRNPSEGEIRRAFVDVASFVRARGTLVSEQKYRDVANALMLEEVMGGKKPVSVKEVRVFGHFMEYYRSKKYSKVIASEDVKDFYLKARASGKNMRMIRKDFTQFRKNYTEEMKRRI